MVRAWAQRRDCLGLNPGWSLPGNGYLISSSVFNVIYLSHALLGKALSRVPGTESVLSKC